MEAFFVSLLKLNSMNPNQQLRVGDLIYLDGCFTEEFFIRGLTLSKIATELGLPSHRIKEGAWIAFAIQLPQKHQFYLGGWTQFATDKFIEYRKNSMFWDAKKYMELYEGKRMPLTIDQAKEAWLSNMRKEKLIKVIPKVAHQPQDVYPPGGIASQIIINTPIQCHIVQLLQPNDVFQGCWG